MRQVHPLVFVGDDADCRIASSRLAVVHACKFPCHQRAIHPRGVTEDNWLVFETGFDLYLNIIDPESPLFVPETFHRFLDFAQRQHDTGRRLLVHCNRGESRSPSLAMLFLAKRLVAISNESHEAASTEFARLYPAYSPNSGIRQYLTEHWSEF